MPDANTRATLTVGIVTRNRPSSLARCLASLTHISGSVGQVIVIDDTSDRPVDDVVAQVPGWLRSKLAVHRQLHAEGYVVGRNTIMRMATSDFVLLLDDDAHLIDRDGILAAMALMQSKREVAAVAFAQAEQDGSPWPQGMQPAPVSYPCRVPAYIGFAHMLRRQAFFEVGGYREELYFYGEEKDLCARLLGRGWHVVFLPHALVAHVVDPNGRSTPRYLRYVVRNDCLFALYNEPLVALCATLPVRLARYFSMRRRAAGRDPWGFPWIVSELVRMLPHVISSRSPLRWSELRLWRKLRREWPAYQVDSVAA